MKRLIALAALCLMAFGCAPQGPARGIVIDKDHTESYSYWVSGIDIPGTPSSCSGTGASYHCTPGTPGTHIPGHFQYVPESWRLKIRDDEKNKEGWRDVNARVYYRCDINKFCDTDE